MGTVVLAVNRKILLLRQRSTNGWAVAQGHLQRDDVFSDAGAARVVNRAMGISDSDLRLVRLVIFRSWYKFK